jgi:hypothetical protein
MGINFPDTPVLNQLHPLPVTPGLPQYRWDGEKWVTATSIDMPGTVRYDTAQALTSSQKAQARANIDCLKKNYIINGAMMVSQENGTTASSASGYYPVDQFTIATTGTTGVYSAAQTFSSPTPAGSTARLRVTVTTADAAVGANDMVWIVQSVEGLRVVDLGFGSAAAKTVTAQFGVKAPAGTYCFAITNGATNRTYVAEYIIAAGEANTSVVKSVVIPGDTTGTWVIDNTKGFELRWGLMVGSTWQQAAGSWGTVNAVGSANQFNFMGTAGNVFELFDVGLYEGTVAPAFQVPDYASELALCQRYYQKFIGFMVAGNHAAGQLMYNGFPIAPQLRATPTSVTFANTSYANASALALNAATQSVLRLNITMTATGYGYGISDVTLNARL